MRSVLHASVMLALSPLLTFAVPTFNVPRGLSGFTFEGGAGKPVSSNDWNFITNLHVNNEVQEYTTSTDNAHLSGSGTVQIIPRKSASGKWTSARLESKGTFTPTDGKVTRVESTLRFGDAPADQKQGIWPAFWMLGDSMRHGTSWPQCGELDIMERINSEPLGHGTPHCGKNDECGASTVAVPLRDNGWHNWAMEIDRTKKDFRQQTITWKLDGKAYNSIDGAKVGEENWKALAHSPLYIILNVAVGGTWPGPPNAKTADGEKNMMEVKNIQIHTL